MHLAGTQQAQVVQAAVGEQGAELDLLRLQQAAVSVGKAAVLTVGGAAGQGVAIFQTAQAALDIAQGGEHFVLNDLPGLLAGAAGRQVQGGADGCDQLRVVVLAVAGLLRLAEALGHQRLPAIALTLVDQAAVGAQAITGLVAAAENAADAARAGAQYAKQGGRAGRVPGAEVIGLLQLQFGVEVDDQPFTVGRRQAVGGRAPTLQFA